MVSIDSHDEEDCISKPSACTYNVDTSECEHSDPNKATQLTESKRDSTDWTEEDQDDWSCELIFDGQQILSYDEKENEQYSKQSRERREEISNSWKCFFCRAGLS